eukprot:CAMPEP_0115543052 /NCGR_PEP_ID=MMETSP0271-20121206/91341_1 /TAXON_ID=71861 /ORGANISM="Scrippsiella trochoidea, Strain CCMP3099" /LENGTH=139 /DNA_ID=CAMNT_0002976259 /DNA_START=118 /DNA_END=534 /DNA_ORIENTATION=-
MTLKGPAPSSELSVEVACEVGPLRMAVDVKLVGVPSCSPLHPEELADMVVERAVLASQSSAAHSSAPVATAPTPCLKASPRHFGDTSSGAARPSSARPPPSCCTSGADIQRLTTRDFQTLEGRKQIKWAGSPTIPPLPL